jgi:Uma2 family endonuclease
MNTGLEIPTLPQSLVLSPPLTDEEFENLCAANVLVQLERTKEGTIIVNAPAGGMTSDGNSEINHQLRSWWKQRRRGRVVDSSAGFFLPDGASLNPDAAYITEEQLKELTKEELRHFLYLAPAFVIELLSSSDSLARAKTKMDSWIANGTLLGWLVDPYSRQVHIYEAGREPHVETGNGVVGTGPVAGFVLDLNEVWGCYEV